MTNAARWSSSSAAEVVTQPRVQSTRQGQGRTFGAGVPRRLVGELKELVEPSQRRVRVNPLERPGGCRERRHETVAVLECAGELDRSLSRGVRLLVVAEQRQVRSSYRAIAALGVGIGVREPDVTLGKQHLGAARGSTMSSAKIAF